MQKVQTTSKSFPWRLLNSVWNLSHPCGTRSWCTRTVPRALLSKVTTVDQRKGLPGLQTCYMLWERYKNIHVVGLFPTNSLLPPAICKPMSPPVLRILGPSKQEVYLMHLTYVISGNIFSKLYICVCVYIIKIKYFLTDRYRSIYTALFTHSLMRISFRKSAQSGCNTQHLHSCSYGEMFLWCILSFCIKHLPDLRHI